MQHGYSLFRNELGFLEDGTLQQFTHYLVVKSSFWGWNSAAGYPLFGGETFLFASILTLVYFSGAKIMSQDDKDYMIDDMQKPTWCNTHILPYMDAGFHGQKMRNHSWHFHLHATEPSISTVSFSLCSLPHFHYKVWYLESDNNPSHRGRESFSITDSQDSGTISDCWGGKWTNPCSTLPS